MNRSPSTSRALSANRDSTAAAGRLVRRLIGVDVGDLRVEVYDGTVLGPSEAATTIRIVSPDFFHRVITGRGSELALSRA